MRGLLRAAGTLVLGLLVVACFQVVSKDAASRLIFTARASSNVGTDACAFPTAPAATPEQTAWQLFVAANCPANQTQVVWETWIEQLQLYPASGATGGAALQNRPKRLHGSPLANAIAKKRLHKIGPFLAPTTQCGKMSLPPPNVIQDATICEEVHLNPEAQSFISTNGYQIRTAQTTAAQKGVDIEFPQPAIEVKVDWIPASDFKPPFTCSAPPKGVHAEIIDGACYAMAGMHIASKLLKNWVWATFEPQSMITNPLRCIAFGPCSDAWGSNPPTSNGNTSGFTDQSPALMALMKQAGLASEFFNYRLDGVQIDFFHADGTTAYLGNSVIEGENAGLTDKQESCITCHSLSSIKSDGTDEFSTFVNLVGNLPATVNVLTGAQYQIPRGWIARDFVWSLAFACPDPTRTGEQGCKPPATTASKKKGKS